MQLIDATNAEAYLRDTGRLAAGDRVRVRELAGGVSNIVLLVEFEDSARAPFVLKQAREQLRVAQPWFCSPERIWREVEVLNLCKKVLARRRRDRLPYDVPTIVFKDNEKYLYAMTAADSNAKTWKAELLSGTVRDWVTIACGRMLGQIHAESRQAKRWHERLQDKRFFIDLRIKPYYCRIAEKHPPLGNRIDKLIDETLATEKCLVHGDFSPKNLLVSPQEVFLIDFEVGHLGDPAFDIGFLLTHLCLKAIHLPDNAALRKLPKIFWWHYRIRLGAAFDEIVCEQRCIQHLLACMLARVDGKSPVDYLDEEEQSKVRAMCLSLFDNPPTTMNDALGRIVGIQ